MTENNLDNQSSEMDEILENFKRTEHEGVRDILKYFDRIHDKLFTFNNILIAGYFALSRFFDSFSIYMIIVPLGNLGLLLFIEYRMMEKSRFESEITKKTQQEIENHGKNIGKTGRYSLYSILATTVVVLIFIVSLFTLNSKTKTASIDKNKTIYNLLIGSWTDHCGENASIAFYKDSMIYVDCLTFLKYDLKQDTLIRYFNGITDTSVINKLTIDSLIIKSKNGIEKYERFKDVKNNLP
jgi:hypothetical protein